MAQERPWPWERDNGCDEDAPAPVAYWEGKPLLRCPPRLVEPWAWQYVALYEPWSQGRPLAAAVFLDEPARLIDAMHVIAAEVERQRDRKREEAERQARAGGAVRQSPVKTRNPVVPSTGPLSKRGRRRG